MKVEQLMSRAVETCTPDDSLDGAARIMWERDCGCVPVTERDDEGARVVGMLTDRDICMAAYTQGGRLRDIEVRNVMSKSVCSCRLTDSIETARSILAQNQLHRLPVLDRDDHLVGILSLADIAREASREHARGGAKEVRDDQVAAVVEAITAERAPRTVMTAA